jgi:hypothetical protein
VGDPHVNTIDNGRYTCHIQGLYVFARTNAAAGIIAQNNLNSNVPNSNLLYPADLFEIRVRSVLVPPALPYIERAQGDASIFSSFTILTNNNYNFSISNNNGRFGKAFFILIMMKIIYNNKNQSFPFFFKGFIINNSLSLTNTLANNLNYDYTNANYTSADYSNQYIYRLQQTITSVFNQTVPQLTFVLWSGEYFVLICIIAK